MKSVIRKVINKHIDFKINHDYQPKIIKQKIPNNIFYVFGLKKQKEEFLFCYYLSILSAKLINKPNNIFFYYHYEPFGKWWEKIKSIIILKKIKIPKYWGKKKIKNYAHASDKLRMELLYNNGGIYMDIDTISIRPYHKFLNYECVMGMQENPKGLCNAIMMCKPKCNFFYLWIKNYGKIFYSSKPGTIGWDLASVILPYRIYLKNMNLVKVLDKKYFFFPNWNQTDLIFEKNNDIDKNLITLHLWESKSIDYLKNINNFKWFVDNINTLYGKIGIQLIKEFNIKNYSDSIK